MDQRNFNTLFTKLDEIHQTLRDLTSVLRSNQQAENNNSKIQNENISSVLEAFRETINSIDAHNKQEKEKNTADKVKESKQKIATAWNNTLHYRKLHFWQHIRNRNTAEIYKSFVNSETIIFPRKFQMKAIVGEPEIQTKIRAEQVQANMRTEIDLMMLRSSNHLEKAIKADEDMKSKITHLCEEDMRDTLYQMWENDTKNQEQISIRIWERKNKPFWIKYEEDFIRDSNSRNPFIKDLPSPSMTDQGNHNNIDGHNSQRPTTRRSTRITRQRNFNNVNNPQQPTPQATETHFQTPNNETIPNTQPEVRNQMNPHNPNNNINNDTRQIQSQPNPFLYRRYPNRQRKK